MGVLMEKIDFDTFCVKQFLADENKSEFKFWLKDKVKGKRSESDWFRLFSEFLKSSFDKLGI